MGQNQGCAPRWRKLSEKAAHERSNEGEACRCGSCSMEKSQGFWKDGPLNWQQAAGFSKASLLWRKLFKAPRSEVASKPLNEVAAGTFFRAFVKAKLHCSSRVLIQLLA